MSDNDSNDTNDIHPLCNFPKYSSYANGLLF